ncbi:MAG: C40 family peptidase [Verrucomicrobiales bacterium]|nr:C40 family peptidase [Verrucomicrobiales bacterium]
MKLNDTRKKAGRVWIWSAILTGIVCLYPVEYQLTRIAVIAGIATTWAGALLLWWKRKTIRVVLIVMGALPAIAVCMPGRSVEPGILAADYAHGLQLFRGVRYVWGGEGFLGIDCSGLVRKGLVWGQLYHGLRTVNGTPIRDAIALWCHDTSALALRDGYRGWTVELFRADSVVEADHSRLRMGDLAVTADGIHVMAYLGSSRWIEADPFAHKVIEVVSSTDNPWFRTPVVFVRWKWLGVSKSPNQIVDRTAASIGIPDMTTVTTSATSLRAFLRRRSLTIGR